MLNSTYPNLAFQTCLSSKVVCVVVVKRQLVRGVCNCGRISVWVCVHGLVLLLRIMVQGGVDVLKVEFALRSKSTIFHLCEY